MAARGTESKNAIFSKLMEVYPDAFWEDTGKILRIPLEENGSRIEIKCTLTAAKSNLGGDEVASAFAAVKPTNGAADVSNIIPPPTNYEPTEEEKANISAMLKSLGL